LVRPSTYVDLFNELASTAVFIGNDSGPGHLAGVIGLPTLILFGPSEPATWRPLGPKVRTLRNLILSDLTVDEVYSVAKEL
jgi:ADP-heptose:LPS heptosyltransferase